MRTKTDAVMGTFTILITTLALVVQGSARAGTLGPYRSSQVREGHFPPDASVTSSGTLYFSANDGTHGVELWKSTAPPSGQRW